MESARRASYSSRLHRTRRAFAFRSCGTRRRASRCSPSTVRRRAQMINGRSTTRQYPRRTHPQESSDIHVDSQQIAHSTGQRLWLRPAYIDAAGTLAPRIVRSARYLSVRSRHPGSANSKSTRSTDVSRPQPARWWNSTVRDRGTRRSRPSFPVRLRSARDCDLRASSPPCGGHYVVELRFGASLIVPLGLHRSTPSHSAPRASRSSSADVAIGVNTSYVDRGQTCNRANAQTAACPQESFVLHDVPQDSPLSTPFDKLRVTSEVMENRLGCGAPRRRQLHDPANPLKHRRTHATIAPVW